MNKKKYLLKGAIQTSQFARVLAKAIDLGLVLLLSLFYYPLGIILGCLYLGVSDHIGEGQSVGKKFIGFAVISLKDGKPCTLKQSIIRNLPFIVPLSFCVIPLWGWIFSALLSLVLIFLEVYLLFKLDSGHRLGDVMADTSVIAGDNERYGQKKEKKGWFDEEVKPVIS